MFTLYINIEDICDDTFLCNLLVSAQSVVFMFFISWTYSTINLSVSRCAYGQFTVLENLKHIRSISMV